MDYFIIIFFSFVGALLTLFSGFGLGTIMLPIFSFFFPVQLSIFLTAIVHLLNNLFKFTLFSKKVDKDVLLKFGLPSIFSAFIGAYLLTFLGNIDPIFKYSLFSKEFLILPIKLVIGVVIIFFSLFEVLPYFKNLKFDRKYLPIGGILSGFFGGLSGNQGALRTTFLSKSNLDKEAFVATGVSIACLVDFSRIYIYVSSFNNSISKINSTLMLSSIISAFLGSYLGSKVLKKITIETLQKIVSVFLIIFSILLIMGIF